jgi:hypothetical protein
MRRPPIPADCERPRQRRKPGTELLWGLRRAVLKPQMADLQAGTECPVQPLQQESFASGTLAPVAGPGNRQPRSAHQGTEPLYGPPPFIPLRAVEGIPGRRWRAGLEVFSSLHTTAAPCAANAWACS